MTGPLAPLFAQVRAGLRLIPWEKGVAKRHGIKSYWSERSVPERDAEAALSSIERHTQNMEKALVECVLAIEQAYGGYGYIPASREKDAVDQAESVLAALPAREKEEE